MFKIRRYFTEVQINYTKKCKCNDLELNNVCCYNRLLKRNKLENVQDYINKYIF